MRNRNVFTAMACATLMVAAACAASAAVLNSPDRAVVDGPAAPDQAVAFNIYLPLRDRPGLEALLDQLHTPTAELYHHWLTPAQFNERFGPQASTVDAISRELAAHGLKVDEVHAHSLHVVGTAGAVRSALGLTLSTAHIATGRSLLIAAAPPKLTPTLAAAGAVIAGFSGQAHMHKTSIRSSEPQNRYSSIGPYWFDDLKEAFSYPSYKVLTGKGVTIGVLMTPGFNPSDMKLYFSHEKLATPNIQTFEVEGGAPYDPNSPDNSAETHIDIQHSGGMAPQASIILFNIPDLYDDSILAGLTDIDEYNLADVINMSFSGPELGYTAAYNGGVDETGILGIYDDFFMQGNAQGITFVAASGDWGAKGLPAAACFSAKPPNPCGAMQVGVGMPSSSPHVTAVGGTNLVTTYDAKNAKDLNSAYVKENADSDPLVEDIFYGTTATGAVWGSGGGISIYYPKPAYQNLVSQQYLPAGAKKWRTTPDLALEMGGCPFGTLYAALHGECAPDRSADIAVIGGELQAFIGTSLSSPDFVGLLALKIESEGSRLGNENYDIYSLAAAQQYGSGNTVFRQDIPGNNGYYSTAPGYNLVLGNGSVIGRDFVRGPSLPAAGVPQTSTNP